MRWTVGPAERTIGRMDGETSAALVPVAVAAATALLVCVVMVLVALRTIHISAPNELLVISGRQRRLSDGSTVGYRVIRGGRAIVIPMLESVARIGLTAMLADVTVADLHARGGQRATVRVVAAVKICGEEPYVHNAVERFLGMTREQVLKVATETLQGCLRNVAAGFDVAELRSGAKDVEAALRREAEEDFQRMGLVMDSVEIREARGEISGYRGRV